MFICINARNLGDAWFLALDKIMSEGRKHYIDSGSYEGIHRIGMSTVINIENPADKPIFPLVPDGIPAPTTQEDIDEYVGYLINGEKQPNEHYTYGEDLSWLVEWVIGHYKKFGHGNNHGYMPVGHPETVLFYDRDVEYSADIKVVDASGNTRTRHIDNAWNKNPDIKTSSQCLRGIDTWIEDGKLHFWVYFRSWDLWGGFPVNLGGIQLLKEYMAAEIGVEDGPMIVACKDLHVYEHTWVVALMRLRKDESLLKR